MQVASEGAADLVDDEGDDIGEAALIADGEPSPLCVVHLALDGAHSGEAGSAEQVEGQEGVAGDSGEGGCDVIVNVAVAAVEQDTHGADDVLLCHQTGDGSHGGLPVAPAQRSEDPSDGTADGSQDGVVDLVFFEHLECTVYETEVGGEPDQDGGQQDDGASLLDEGPAAFPHGAQDVAHGGPMVCGQLHDEGSGVAGEHLGLFQDDAGDDDAGHAQEVSGGGNPCGAAEDSAGDHRNKGHLSAAGDEGGGHDGHTAVTFVLDGTRGHDAGHAAAGADEDGDEALAGQAELTEDTVQDEGDTSHVAAGFQEGQQQEQDQHLRHEAQDCAHASDDTIQDQAAEPGSCVGSVQAVADEDGDAGHPNAVGGGVRSAIGFLVFGVLILCHSVFQVSLLHVVHSFDCQSLLVFHIVGDVGVSGRCRNQSIQGGLGTFFGVAVGFHIQSGGDVVVAIFTGERVDDEVGVTILFFSVRKFRGADAEQMPAVAEHAVVGPLGRGRAHGDHGDVVHQEHDDDEDGQTQPAVGDHLVDLVGGGELTGVGLLVAALDDRGDVDVTVVGDDGLGVIIQLGLCRHNVLFDVFQNAGIQLQRFDGLAVPFKQLDGVPALLFFGQVVDSHFLNVSDGVFHGAGEGVHGDGLGALCGGDRSLSGQFHAVALQSGDLDHLAAQLLGQLIGVDGVAVLAHHVHHVDGDNHGDAQLGQLRGQIQVTFQVGAVDDVQDGIGTLVDEVVSGHHFFQGVGGQGIDTGKVGDDDIVVLLQTAFLLFHRNAGPVADELVGAGEGIEQGCFTTVWVARQSDG